MAQPLLDSPQIHSGRQAPGCECRAKLMQPELFLFELRSLGTGFEIIQEVELWTAPCGGEDQATGFVSFAFTPFNSLTSFGGDGDLAPNS